MPLDPRYVAPKTYVVWIRDLRPARFMDSWIRTGMTARKGTIAGPFESCCRLVGVPSRVFGLVTTDREGTLAGVGVFARDAQPAAGAGRGRHPTVPKASTWNRNKYKKKAWPGGGGHIFFMFSGTGSGSKTCTHIKILGGGKLPTNVPRR